jgi:hypothetical protein
MMPASTPVIANTPIASWLLPTSGDARIHLERLVTQAGATHVRRTRPLQTLGAVARRALVDEIEAKLRMVLGETLVDLIAGGWRAYGAVTQAIQQSRNQLGVDHIVPLRNHTITAARQHNLDVEVDRFPVMTLSVQLTVRVQLYDAVAVVRDGYLVAIRSGRPTASGTVTVEGVTVAQRAFTFPLAAELALRSPVLA